MKRIITVFLMLICLIGSLSSCMLPNDKADNAASVLHNSDQVSNDLTSIADEVIASARESLTLDEYWKELKKEVVTLRSTEMLKTIYSLSALLCGSGKTVLLQSYSKEKSEFDGYDNEWVSHRYIDVLMRYCGEAEISGEELEKISDPEDVSEYIQKYRNEYIKKKTYDNEHFFVKGNSEKDVYLVFVCSLKECFSEFLYDDDLRNNAYSFSQACNRLPYDSFSFLPFSIDYGYKTAIEFVEDENNWTDAMKNDLLNNGYVISFRSIGILNKDGKCTEIIMGE